MDNKLKTAALSFGIAILFGSVAIGCAGTDTSSERSSESRSDTTTAPVPAAVVVQPAPVVVAPAPVVAAPMNSEHSSSHSASSDSSPSGDSEHSSSHSASSDSSPSGNSTSEKSSNSRSSSY